MTAPKPYNLNLTTPGGKCAAEADTMKDLVEITPRGLFGETGRTTGPQESKLGIVSRDLWAAFLETVKGCRKSRHSKISRAGCELKLMECYLLNMAIEETVALLKNKHRVDTSKSAVGRYWSVLAEIGPEFKARL